MLFFPSNITFMAYIHSRHFLALCLSLLLFLYVTHSSSTSEVYIVYLGSKIHDDPRLTSNHHLQLLSNVFSSEKEAKRSIVYHYKHSFSGFSAMLNSSQASELAERKEVISVFKSKMLESRTTRSWDFLGLTIGSHHHHHDGDDDRGFQLKYGDDTIVGVIDSGVWPESESFREEASMKGVPRRWRGICQKGEMFDSRKHCNKKLIGARYYPNAYEVRFGRISCLNTTAVTECRSARDFAGHGTHTASTAVGSVVKVPDGLGKGVARGGAPRARLAVYKACWVLKTDKGFDMPCLEADILKAFDHALRDGVDVISVSLGSGPPLRDFFNWSASIGSFHAHQLGVTVVFSAGNNGPTPGTVENVMPWAISVAASTIDRTFPTAVVAPSHNLSLLGQSFNFGEKTVLKAQLALAEDYFRGGVCDSDSLKPNISAKSAAGKALLCFRWKREVGPAASAASTIGFTALLFAEPVPKPDSSAPFPVLWLDDSQGLLLRRLARTHTSSPLNLVMGPTRTAVAASVAPAVSDFSSRGPNSVDPDILKPDMAAPGFNILAAWPPVNADGLDLDWNFQSGTSMACPHVAGIAALLRSAHPDWSPSAIRSALATTASPLDSSGSRIVSDDSNMPSDPLSYGAGQVDPLRAMDPGLVYDMTTADHVSFLCNQGYTPEQLEMILLPCSLVASCDGPRPTTSGLNYPSISVSDLRTAVTVRRTVRNVGPSKVAVYASSVVEPDGVEVSVWPRVLVFWWFREEITYSVTLTPKKKSRGIFDFGEIVWTNTFGAHTVRTPLVVQVNTLFPNNTFVDDHDHDRHLLTQPA